MMAEDRSYGGEDWVKEWKCWGTLMVVGGWGLGGTMELGIGDQGVGGKLDGGIGGLKDLGGIFGMEGGWVLDWGVEGVFWGKGDPGTEGVGRRIGLGLSEGLDGLEGWRAGQLNLV